MQVNNVEDYGGVISVYNNNSYFVYYLNSYAIHSTATLQPDSVVLNNLDEVLTVQGMHQAEFGYNDLFEVTNYFLEDILSGTFHSYNCTWNGGNMQQRTTDGSLDTATVSYYTDKPYTLGDGYELPLFLTYGNVIFHSKNLTRAITSQLTHINYSYTFDNAGRITTTQSFQTDSTVWSALVDTVIHSYTINYTAY